MGWDLFLAGSIKCLFKSACLSQIILWMEEILHQLINHDKPPPSIYRVSTIQGGAGFRNHPQEVQHYHRRSSNPSLLKCFVTYSSPGTHLSSHVIFRDCKCHFGEIIWNPVVAEIIDWIPLGLSENWVQSIHWLIIIFSFLDLRK